MAINKDLTVDWLKENNYDIYFFGLGFIQVKIDQKTRIHFYHPELPAFVESPHDHRYNFISKVIKGRLVNKIWEKISYSGTDRTEPGTEVDIEFTSCKKSGQESFVPDSFKAAIKYIGEFEINKDSSYYINRNTFHTVTPDFTAGPCVTWVTRGPIERDFARVLRFPDDKKECPFSKVIEIDELWDIVDRCLK